MDISWQQVAEYDFSSMHGLDGLPVVAGEWALRDGRLRAVGGDRNRAILLHQGIPDPVRIEMIVMNKAQRGLLGDITVLLNVTADDAFFRSGYALTTGSYWNACTTFYREGLPIANTGRSPLQSGRRYRVAVEYSAGHLRYELDGELLLEAWDARPLALSDARWIGVRTWATRMCIERITIFTDRPGIGSTREE